MSLLNLQVFYLHSRKLADFMIKKPYNTPSLFSSLSDMLNQSHPLYKLAEKIDWAKFDTAFKPLYCQNNGRPAKPIRLMCGLLILKHLRRYCPKKCVRLVLPFSDSTRGRKPFHCSPSCSSTKRARSCFEKVSNSTRISSLIPA